MKIYQKENYILIITDGYYGILYDKELNFLCITHNAETIINEYKEFKEIEYFEFALSEEYKYFLENFNKNFDKKIKEFPFGKVKQKKGYIKEIKEFIK